jgi:hypothetical protein
MDNTNLAIGFTAIALITAGITYYTMGCNVSKKNLNNNK